MARAVAARPFRRTTRWPPRSPGPDGRFILHQRTGGHRDPSRRPARQMAASDDDRASRPASTTCCPRARCGYRATRAREISRSPRFHRSSRHLSNVCCARWAFPTRSLPIRAAPVGCAFTRGWATLSRDHHLARRSYRCDHAGGSRAYRFHDWRRRLVQVRPDSFPLRRRGIQGHGPAERAHQLRQLRERRRARFHDALQLRLALHD